MESQIQINAELFLDLSSQDDEKRENATQKITSCLPSPIFFNYLFDLLGNTEVQDQTRLYTQILVVFKASLNAYFKTLSETEELILRIPLSLIGILNKVPLNYHPYIAECFRVINTVCSEFQPENFHTFQVAVVPVLIGCIKEQQNLLSNMYVLRLFFKFFFLESDETSRLNDFFQMMILELVPVFTAIIQCTEINEFTAEVSLNLIKILISIINNEDESGHFQIRSFFDSSVICSIVHCLSRYFLTEYQCSLNLNRKILAFYKEICYIYFGDPFFDEKCVPFLFSVIIQLLPKTIDEFIKQNILKIVYSMFKSDYFRGEINSPGFIENVLIPAAKLSPEDIADLSELPSRVSYYFGFSRYSKRKIIRKLANILLHNPLLYSIVLSSRPSDVIDFESRIYILGCINPRDSLVQKAEIDYVTNCAMNIANNPPFLQSSFLFSLSRFSQSKYSEPDLLLKIGVQSIIVSQEPAVILAASKLLKSESLNFSDYSETDEAANIIPKLLALCTAINAWQPLDVILKYMNQATNCSSSFIKTVMEILFGNCHSYVMQDSDNPFTAHSLERTLATILNLYESLIYHYETETADTTVYCLSQLIEIFRESQSYIYYIYLCNFIGYFNYNLIIPHEAQFEFVLMCASNEVFVENTLFCLLDIVYPLILNPNSNVSSRRPFIDTVTKVCQNYAQQLTNGSLSVTLVDLSSLLKVCGGLIEVFGNFFIGFAQLPFSLLKGYRHISDHFASILYIIYNSMRVNCDLVMTLFDDTTLDVLLNNNVASTSQNGKYFKCEVKAHFLVLLELARRKIPRAEECFRIAIGISKCFLGAHMHEGLGMVSKGAYSYSMSDMLRCYPSAIDQVNEWEFFDQVLKETGFALTDLEQKIIEDIIA